MDNPAWGGASGVAADGQVTGPGEEGVGEDIKSIIQDSSSGVL